MTVLRLAAILLSDLLEHPFTIAVAVVVISAAIGAIGWAVRRHLDRLGRMEARLDGVDARLYTLTAEMHAFREESRDLREDLIRHMADEAVGRVEDRRAFAASAEAQAKALNDSLTRVHDRIDAIIKSGVS